MGSVIKTNRFSLYYAIVAVSLLITACPQPVKPNPQQPDKTLLLEKITEARELYNSLEISADGKDVYKSKYWVTSRAVLEFAVETAQGVYDKQGAAKWEIDAALQELIEAYNTINAAKKPGLLDDPVVDKTAMKQAIAAALAKMAGVVEADDGSKVLTGEFWATGTMFAALRAAVAAAEAADTKENVTQGEVDAAAAALSSAIAAFVPQPGLDDGQIHETDKTVLKQTIGTARAKMSNVVQSDDGLEILSNRYWATGAMFAALEGAIAAAEAVDTDGDATQHEVDAITAELAAAVAAFVPQIGLLEPKGIIFNFTGPQDETITLTGAQALSWIGNTPLHISVAESFDSYLWFVDGILKAGETGNSVMLYARDFSTGSHIVTLRVTKGGVPYTKTLTFTVN